MTVSDEAPGKLAHYRLFFFCLHLYVGIRCTPVRLLLELGTRSCYVAYVRSWMSHAHVSDWSNLQIKAPLPE